MGAGASASIASATSTGTTAVMKSLLGVAARGSAP